MATMTTPMAPASGTALLTRALAAYPSVTAPTQPDIPSFVYGVAGVIAATPSRVGPTAPVTAALAAAHAALVQALREAEAAYRMAARMAYATNGEGFAAYVAETDRMAAVLASTGEVVNG